MSLTSLKRIKEPPLTGEQYSIKERSGEIRDLEKQKDTLAKEVKKLGEIFFRLEEGEKKVRANVENITTERLGVISKISKQISSELEGKSSELEQKLAQLDKRDLLLMELLEYLDSYAQIVEAERLLNEQKAVLLEKREVDTSKALKSVLVAKSKGKEALKRAKRVENTIDARYEKADDLCRWFEREVDKEKHRLESWSKTIKLREKKVAAEKRALKRIEKKQEDRGIWLMDREEMLSRTMSEVRKRENDIIKNG